MGLPPRVPVDRVIIIVKPEEDVLNFRVIVPTWKMMACSPVMTVKRGPYDWDDNPYGVYGDTIEEWVGCSKHDVSISVARCNSGEL
jgi:hypothetical protein